MMSETGRSEFANLDGEDDERMAFEDAAESEAGDERAEALEARIVELETENSDVKDRLLRLAADMENLRRRTEREVKDARSYAVTNFAREILSVADNLRRAVDAVPDEARSGGDKTVASLIEGVEMTERGLQASLEKHGVRKLDPEGQRFDPNFHQAMFEVPNPDVPNNTVVQVVQAGYAIGERVLRPAMVGVSKGGPKQSAPRPDAATQPEGEESRDGASQG
ncbi:nucleotide exchange factor GrpE [Fulvimarina endophytica]|uniref:Protein GrpE n=1 Tax=Fulvimarina endophytica TaxID=2293836 RepID=A0A371X257_9HYPH|nr:nucleotide exchange factor GrpE [Fulvimarina endophytica]RFC63289.1 nucleotide exchange factor GrpE [Fulvimarina endophytica]